MSWTDEPYPLRAGMTEGDDERERQRARRLDRYARDPVLRLLAPAAHVYGVQLDGRGRPRDPLTVLRCEGCRGVVGYVLPAGTVRQLRAPSVWWVAPHSANDWRNDATDEHGRPDRVHAPEGLGTQRMLDTLGDGTAWCSRCGWSLALDGSSVRDTVDRGARALTIGRVGPA